MPAPLSYNAVLREGSAGALLIQCVGQGRAARCRRQAATGKKISQIKFDGVLPVPTKSWRLLKTGSTQHEQ